MIWHSFSMAQQIAKRNLTGGTVRLGIHSFAPGQCLLVQILQIGKITARKEVVLHISDQPLHFTLSLGRPYPANFRDKAHRHCKVGKLCIPDNLASFASRNYHLHMEVSGRRVMTHSSPYRRLTTPRLRIHSLTVAATSLTDRACGSIRDQGFYNGVSNLLLQFVIAFISHITNN